jgi:uncharacterized protein
MTAYVDSSVVLRIVLTEAGRLREWRRIERAYASELIRLECLRSIDRARLRLGLADSAVAAHRAAVMDVVDSLDIVRIDDAVLERAADPFPTALGSLDAIHLATAILLRSRVADLCFATHDNELATGARAVGLKVYGVPRR